MSSSIGMMRFPTEWEKKKWQPNHQPDIHKSDQSISIALTGHSHLAPHPAGSASGSQNSLINILIFVDEHLWSSNTCWSSEYPYGWLRSPYGCVLSLLENDPCLLGELPIILYSSAYVF